MSAAGRPITRRPRLPHAAPVVTKGLSPHLRIAGDLFIAVQTNEIGVAVASIGPFRDRQEAEEYVTRHFEANGYAVPFRLAFRSL